MSPTDQVLRRIAARQLNLITRTDARGERITDKQLSHRIATGVLGRIHNGVYLWGGGPLSAEQQALAACLACGEGAFASSRTAASLWRVCEAADVVEVTVPDTARPAVPGILIHRSRFTGRGEQTLLGCVPVATIARTLYDLRGVVGRAELERACDNAFRLRLITPERVASYLDGKTRPGVLLDIARDRMAHGVHDTEFEREAERVLLDHGLPRPARQYPFVANGRSVRFDLFYPQQRVAIEPNGRAPHWGKERWQADHDKRLAARIAGVDMLEFTWDDVHERQLYFVTTVGDALGLKPAKWVEKAPSAGGRTRPGGRDGAFRSREGRKPPPEDAASPNGPTDGGKPRA